MIIHPPYRKTQDGNTRRVGVEIEFHGLDAHEAANVVAEALGGKSENGDAFHASIDVPELGEFKVKLDTALVEKHDDPTTLERLWDGVRETAAVALSGVTPVEVIAPPIDYNRLDLLDGMVDALREAGAKGTGQSVLYAFGMHLNPETWSDDPAEIWRLLSAYAMAEPWLRDQLAIDPSRRVLPFVDPYSPNDVAEIACTSPQSMDALIDFYGDHFPTRNFGLDLLPLLAHYDEERLSAKIGDGDTLMASRPTFHYRLPDCRIDDADWGVVPAWVMWVKIEEIACDEDCLTALRSIWSGKGRLTAPTGQEIAEIVT